MNTKTVAAFVIGIASVIVANILTEALLNRSRAVREFTRG